jgi:hypothetical protein
MTVDVNQIQENEPTALNKRVRFIIALAVVGFVFTGILYVSIAITRTSEPPTRLEIGLGVLSLVLCPPSVLYTLMFDIDLYSIPGASI